MTEFINSIPFTLILIVINIYCFIKKKYLYLFVACILFLPNYYGIELSGSLPIFTVARMMYIVFFIYTYMNRRRDISLKGIKINTIPKEYFFLIGYFLLRIITNLYYSSTYSSAIKTIFLIVFEQLFFLICIYLLAPTKKEITTLINVIVYTAAAFYLIGIFESITHLNPFNALYTVSRYMLNSFYIRLGLLRATTTFGLANYYGNMCVLTLPLILYMYEKSRKTRYIIFSALNFLAIVHSGCRSDMFLFFLIIAVYFFALCLGKQRKKAFMIHFCIATLATIGVIVIASVISPLCKYYYTGTAKSLLNEVGFDFDLDEGRPEGVTGYGANAESGTQSRLVQFTCVQYAFKVNPFFGQGSGVEQRGELMIFSKGEWKVFSAFDVGYVNMLVSEGLIGFFGFISLIIYLLMCSIKKDLPIYYKRLCILLIAAYLLCLLSTSNMYAFLLLYVVIIDKSKILAQSIDDACTEQQI